MNLYTYVYNNPTRYHDPSGNIPLLVALIGKQVLNYGLDVMIGVGTDYLDHLNTKSGTFNVKASIKKNAKDSIVPGLSFLKKVKKAYKLADGINDALKKAKKAKGKHGSYTIEFESGKKYHGKGSKTRMDQSAKEKSRKYNDPVKSKNWKTSPDERQAFKDEYERLKNDGGHKSDTNYNRRASPGQKYTEQDK